MQSIANSKVKPKKFETKMGAKVRKIKKKINTTTTITTVKIETNMGRQR